MMTLRGSSELVGSTLQLTDGGVRRSRRPGTAKRVGVDNFNIEFTFTLPSSTADGFTFTLQNSGKGNWASGGNGSALGYQGISNSVAIKFGLFNDSTQQEVSQTGLLTNGAAPSTVAIDMSGSNINLHSGSVYSVSLVYNGATLTETVTDTHTLATFTHSYKVNIASVLGSTTAYAGFTAGTGAFTSVQDILKPWVFGQLRLIHRGWICTSRLFLQSQEGARSPSPRLSLLLSAFCEWCEGMLKLVDQVWNTE